MTRNDKIVLVLGVVAAGGLFLFGRSCGIDSVLKKVGTVKTITKDSLIFRDTGSIIPYAVYTKGKDGKPYPVLIHDTTPGELIVRIDPADTAAILERYYQTAYYRHQFDTGRWKITVDESITENRLKDWSMKVVSSDTSTTNTVQLKPPKPIVISLLLSNIGNVNNLSYIQGFGFSVRTPNDKEYQFQRLNVPGHKPMYQATVSLPIRNPFKKR